MKELLIGFILGLTCLFVQFQYSFTIETWIWFIGIIAILYAIATAVFPPLAIISLGVAGFVIGVLTSLAIWTFLPEFQSFFSLIIVI